ncbi:hypothetical protein VSR68_32910 [Paraburkholderia phymatum]|uniref:hypothetical protein n=1 Tax=Paraburkholderia phymatum TaxID=148447 RepID=UPI003180DE8B
MFDITDDHIARLNDVDLRELVARLCEAELESLELSPAAVTWGGNQTASDGGLDVRVALPNSAAIDGYIPRLQTGFQVKKPDMARASILQEMRPDGEIRPAIAELVRAAGAYVIVSSASSVSDSALRNRRNAMIEALDGVADAANLATDFYDRRRMASWTNRHPGLVAWVRERVGSSVSGWRPHGAWSATAKSAGAEYLMDDTLRADLDTAEGFQTSARDALDAISKDLAAPRAVVRLVGLSGVGKTRFAQALFDRRIGTSSLPASLAIYTNLTDEPDPPPVALLTNLIANGKRAVLVVDNCPPDLHERLTETCRRENSKVSLLTIEYDVRDDQPEGTHVVRLHQASAGLITDLIQGQFPHLSRVDSETIARAAGGNARVALALAETVERGGSVAGLSNEALFDRLFRQRQDRDNDLLRTAQACAMVYSFDGESHDGESAELPRVAALAGQTSEQTYRHVNELLRRELVQKRGVWRALLPHALANRLASRAIEDTPYSLIEEHLLTHPRLARSFSRRLFYLHEQPKVVAIADNWLAPDGWLGSVAELNDLGRAMFENIAPISPEATLTALERAMGGGASTQLRYWTRRINILRALAYEPAFFRRSAELLARIATEPDKTAADAFLSLFQIRLSGTCAPIELRLEVIATLLHSSEEAARKLGLDALNRTLQTEHFNSFGQFDFGSRSRGYGLHPSTVEDIAGWFHLGLRLLDEVASTTPSLATPLRTVLTQRLRGLWKYGYVHLEVDALMRKFAVGTFWPDGWGACRQALHFLADSSDPHLSRLTALEQALRPITLSDKVRAIVLHEGNTIHVDALLDTDGPTETSHDRIKAAASSLGESVAADRATFEELLAEMLTKGRWAFPFGRGLAAGSRNRRRTWICFVEQLTELPAERRRIDVLCGFLAWLWENERSLADELLDAAVDDPTLRTAFPYLQASVQLDERAAKRLGTALDLDIAEIGSYSCLGLGRTTAALPADALRDLLLEIAARPGGPNTALNVLFMHIWGIDRTAALPPELVDAGKRILPQVEFSEDTAHRDMEIAHVAKNVLGMPDAHTSAVDFMDRFGKAVSQRRASWSDYTDTLRVFFELHPEAVLDVLLQAPLIQYAVETFAESSNRPNPADAISSEQLIAWCEKEAELRYLQAARIIGYSKSDEDVGGLTWSEQAAALLKHAPDPIAVLRIFVEKMSPYSWSGSRASIIESNAKLLCKLDDILPETIMPSVREAQRQLNEHIAVERRSEANEARIRDETFE